LFPEPSILLHESHDTLGAARLYPYFLRAGSGGCVLVLPGGGYAGLARHEGPHVAGWLNSIGIAAVVLEYSVGKDLFPRPQQQALYAMRLLRSKAKEYRIDPQHIGVIGFSAGGHLAASVANGFDRPSWLLDPDNALDGISARPDAAILAYPVLTSGEFAHRGSFNNLLGEQAGDAEEMDLSWELSVHPEAPPHFLWHTADDGSVPVENTYLMAMSLRAKRIPHEVHVYPTGAHGLGLCSLGDKRQGRSSAWKAAAETWLMDLGF